MCENSYVEITDSDLGEAGIDIDAYSEILKTVHKLIPKANERQWENNKHNST